MIPFIRRSKTSKRNNELFRNSERSHVVEYGTKTSKIQNTGFTEENTKQSGMKNGSPGVFKGLGVSSFGWWGIYVHCHVVLPTTHMYLT